VAQLNLCLFVALLNSDVEGHQEHRLAVLHSIHQRHVTQRAASVLRQRRVDCSLLLDFGVLILATTTQQLL
jgi:hypothetical protein